MVETLCDLVVSLSLESSNFSCNIKSVNAMDKEAQNAFSNALDYCCYIDEIWPNLE